MKRETVTEAMARGVETKKCPAGPERLDTSTEHRPWAGVWEYRATPRNRKSKAYFVWLFFTELHEGELKEMRCRGGFWIAIYADKIEKMRTCEIEERLIQMGWKKKNRAYR